MLCVETHVAGIQNASKTLLPVLLVVSFLGDAAVNSPFTPSSEPLASLLVSSGSIFCTGMSAPLSRRKRRAAAPGGG